MKKVMVLIAACSAVLMAGIVFASEAAHEAAGAAEEGHEAMTFMGDWLPRIVNFAIIAGVVVYFMRKPVRDFFKNRSADIAKALQESKEARERAIAALVEMERKVKDLEVETNRLIEDARVRGEKDKLALIEEGKKMVSDIDTQVKQGVELEVQKAVTALQAEASMLAMDLAEKSIKEKINPKDHERIVKEYITKVGGRG